jgi:Flp pilus assembly protein TadG
MAVELALLTVALVVLMLFVVAVGRVSQVQGSIEEAATDAARAASIARTADVAVSEGRRVALADLAADRVACPDPEVDIDAVELQPGGQVRAVVTCQVPFGDLVLLRLPGARQISASAVEVVDVYRSSG